MKKDKCLELSDPSIYIIWMTFRFDLKMARVNKVRRKANSRLHRATPFPLSSHPRKVLKDVHLKKKHSKALAKKGWEDATCSVCMEFPHNAVLLLCSSYEKGCRPYMCATSCRYSNCLDQYKKAYTKVTSTQSSPQSQGSTENLSLGSHSGLPNEKMEVSELLCPLCRGQVKGWTVVEPAREYLNAKKRTCMQDNCSYVGTYKQLRKHVRAEHPLARPREVDPSLEEKWKRLEGERERNDVLSTIRSSMPGALILGDYVIEGNYHGFYRDYAEYDAEAYFDDALFSLDSFGRGRRGGIHLGSRFNRTYDLLDEEDHEMRRHVAAPGRGLHRLLYGRSRRRQRHREANGER